MFRPIPFLFLAAGLVFAAVAATPADQPGIFAPDAKLEKLVEGCKFTEGPAVDARGDVYFSDAMSNRIYVYDAAEGRARIWKEPSRGANGMMFDRQGRLITCNCELAPDGRSVTRYEKDGSVTVLADRYAGKKLNAPNDLAIDREGRIYFTDPVYVDESDIQQDRMAVYRIEKSGALTRVIDDVQMPNGILITPDGRTLYVADHSSAPRGARTLIAYDLRKGKAKRRAVLHDFGAGRGIDGMVLDVKGNVYATAGAEEKSGVYVFSPDGRLLTFLQTPGTATNCTFGDPDLRTLYVTAGGGLYRTRTQNPGYLVYPGRR